MKGSINSPPECTSYKSLSLNGNCKRCGQPKDTHAYLNKPPHVNRPQEGNSSIFLLFFQALPKDAIRPWKIGEIITTSEGLRTRLTSYAFRTEQEAKDTIAELERKIS